MHGYETIERIEDLRADPRAEPFWFCCGPHIECVEDVIAIGGRPTCRHGFTLDTKEAMRLWKLIEGFKVRAYQEEPGKEILVDSDNWGPIDGVHRASVLYVLDKKVPALLIHRPKPRNNRWVFRGIWKPKED